MEKNRGMISSALRAVLAVILGFALGLAVAWILFTRRKAEGEPGEERTVDAYRVVLEPRPDAPTAASAAEPDDLTRIEGIGPKLSRVLRDAGIRTFGRLAESRPEDLARIVRDEDERLGRLVDPTTWPEQASLAAAAAWETLEELQEELTAGRRV